MREENIVSISDYLRANFPECTVADEEADADHIFRVTEKESAEEVHTLQVAEDFLDDTPPLEVGEELEQFNIAERLRDAGRNFVRLTPEGLEEPGG